MLEYDGVFLYAFKQQLIGKNATNIAVAIKVRTFFQSPNNHLRVINLLPFAFCHTIRIKASPGSSTGLPSPAGWAGTSAWAGSDR